MKRLYVRNGPFITTHRPRPGATADDRCETYCGATITAPVYLDEMPETRNVICDICVHPNRQLPSVADTGAAGKRRKR